MTETARLVVAVDSSDAPKATAALERLAETGKKTEAATQALQAEVARLKSELEKLSKSEDKTTKSTDKLEREMAQLKDRLDPTSKQLKDMGRLQELLTRALEKGVISVDKYEKEMAQLADRHRQYQASLSKVTPETDRATSGFERMRRVLTTLGVITAAGLGLRAIISNTIEAEQVQAQLEARLKSTGGAAGITLNELNAMAQGLQKVTTFGDEAIGTAQGLLLTFTSIGKENFGGATEAVLNLAVAMNTDLDSAAKMVGKALNAPIEGLTAMSRAGVQFTDDQKALIKTLVETGQVAEAQRIILGELEVQMGGSARAARDTLGGALEAAKNAFGDLLEGDTGSDGVRGTVSAINQLTDTMQSESTKAGFQVIIQNLADVTRFTAETISMLGGLSEILEQSFKGVEEKSYNGLIQEQLRLEARLKSVAEGGQTGAGPFANRAKAIEALENRLKEVIRLQDEYNRQQNGRALAAETGGSSGSPNGRGRGVRVVEAAATDQLTKSTEKLVAKLGEEAAAYGLSRSAALELDKQRDLNKASTEAERQAITEAYDALILKVQEDERATASTKGASAASTERAAAERAATEALREFESAQASLNGLLQQQAATLGGPLVQAAQEYANTMTMLLMEEQKLIELGKLELDQQNQLALARENANLIYQETVAAIQAQQGPAERLLSDLQFELELQKMSNAERAVAIQLRGLDSESITKYGDAIRAANEKIEEGLRATQALDEFRGMATDAFSSFIDGSKSASEALDDLAANMTKLIARRLSEQLIESLFGAPGTNQSGSAGGFFSNLIGSLFGGNRASGGDARAGKMYKVNEFEPEMVSVGNDDYLMMGSKGGRVSSANTTNTSNTSININVPPTVQRRTAEQLANRLSEVQSRNAARNR